MRRLKAILGFGCALLWLGCSTYEPKVAPFKLPEAYANMQRVAGAYIGARAWSDEMAAQDAFGFNIIRAGLLPVQVSFDNRGKQTLAIVPSQTFLINGNKNCSRYSAKTKPMTGCNGHPGSGAG